MTILKEMLHKYKSLSTPVRASIWFTICSFIQKAISMITTPVFTRLLSTEEYGLFSVYQSWSSILFIIITLSISSGVFNNGMVKFEDDRDAYISSIQGLITISAVLLFCIYLLFSKDINNLLELPTIFVGLIFIQSYFEMPFSLWSSRQRFEHKYQKLVAVTLFIAIFSPILGVIGVLNTKTYKTEARIISFVFVQAIFGIWFLFYNQKHGKKWFNKVYWKYTLSLALPLIPHYLSMIVLQQADRIMISRMCGNDKAAIYSVSYSVSTIAITFINSINASFVPYIYQNIKRKEYQGIRSSANFLLVFVSCLSIFMMALGPELVSFFAPEQYHEAIWIIPPVASSVFFQFQYSLFSNVELYYEKKWYITTASICGALLNIILNHVFISSYGYVAAGYTTLFCYLAFAVFHYIMYRKTINTEISPKCYIYDIRFQLFSSLGVLCFMFGVLYTYKHLWLRYTIIIVIILLSFVFRKTILMKLRELKK